MRAIDYGPWIPGGRGGNRNSIVYTNGMLTCSKKEWMKRNMISEENGQLVNKNFTMSPTAKDNMTAGKDSAGENFAENGASYNNMTTIKSRLEKYKRLANNGDASALNTYENMGGDELKKEVDNKLKTATKNAETIKNNKKELGYRVKSQNNTNVFKNDNGTNSSITYFEN